MSPVDAVHDRLSSGGSGATVPRVLCGGEIQGWRNDSKHNIGCHAKQNDQQWRRIEEPPARTTELYRHPTSNNNKHIETISFPRVVMEEVTKSNSNVSECVQGCDDPGGTGSATRLAGVASTQSLSLREVKATNDSLIIVNNSVNYETIFVALVHLPYKEPIALRATYLT